MAVQLFDCPHCDTNIRPARRIAPGKQIRCPKCSEIFRVPPREGRTPVPVEAATIAPRRTERALPEPQLAEEERSEPRAGPRPRCKKPKVQRRDGNQMALWLTLGSVAVLVAVGLTLYFTLGGGSSSDDAAALLGGDVSKESHQKIKSAMTLDEVEKILGKGRSVKESDVEEEFDDLASPGGMHSPAAGFRQNERTCGVDEWYRWTKGDQQIFVGLRDDGEGTDRVALTYWIRKYKQNGGTACESHVGVIVARQTSLARIAKENKEFEEMLADPKWKKGAAMQQALLGKWLGKHSPQRKEYEFLQGGTYRRKDVFQDFQSRYRFTDDQHVELSVPGSQVFPKRAQDVKQTYRVLVGDTELQLIPEPARPGIALQFTRAPR